jgi:hypothetical protein
MSHELVELAMRQRLATLVVATTGSTTLSATASGYARASGSFVADGFTVGMQVRPSGFPQSAPGTITQVTATTMAIYGGRSAVSAASGRALLASTPVDVVYDNVDYEPKAFVPFLEATLIGQPSRQLTFPANGGVREDMGIYVLRWWHVAGLGSLVARRCADAVMTLFAPGTVLVGIGGGQVRVSGDPGPFASELTRAAAGHVLQTITIPWRTWRTNVVVP